MKQRVCLLTLVTPVVASACILGGESARLERMASTVTIHRDDFGAPHVVGGTDASAAFGFAYAQAEDNFWQIEDNFIRAIGRAAEVHGEAALLDDWINRALGITRLSQEEYDLADPSLRALLDGFADGLNYYLLRNPAVETRLIDHFEPWYSLAFIRYVYYQRGFLGATRIRRQEFVAALEQSIGQEFPELASLIPQEVPRSEVGSNSWAIGPAKSATGNTMLLINPHLPFFGASQVYEGHVMSEEGWNFSGYTRFGFPLPYIGFNERLGWMSTDNAADQQDAYTVVFDDPEQPLAYRYGADHRNAIEWVDTLKVSTDGGVEQRTATFRSTHHGPVVALRNDLPLAVKMSKFEEPGWLAQWYAMTKSTTLNEFTAAVSNLDMLFGNILYADGDGNIFYVYNAAMPRRSEEFDWTEPVDGSDPATEWQGYHPLEELPQLLNPATGWLQNCNGTPFMLTSSGNPDPDDFPNYMVREGDNPRHKEARRILEAQDKFTFDEWARSAYSTHVGEAQVDIADLVAEWRRLSGQDLPRAADLTDAVTLLRRWDRVSTIESEAMTLYVAWGEQRRVLRQSGSNIPWANMVALERATARLDDDWGTWRVAWGELNRLQRPHTSGSEPFSDDRPSIPVAGVPGWAGAMFTFNAVPADGQRRRYGTHGNSYVAVVEFGSEVTARSLHTFGSSADPESPHYFDQAPRYAVGDFKPAWLTVRDVEQHAARAYKPGEGQ